ncbi:MAG: hypothetical protein ACOYN0_18485 [Phycisphaerales bacterium]
MRFNDRVADDPSADGVPAFEERDEVVAPYPAGPTKVRHVATTPV